MKSTRAFRSASVEPGIVVENTRVGRTSIEPERTTGLVAAPGKRPSAVVPRSMSLATALKATLLMGSAFGVMSTRPPTVAAGLSTLGDSVGAGNLPTLGGSSQPAVRAEPLLIATPASIPGAGDAKSADEKAANSSRTATDWAALGLSIAAPLATILAMRPPALRSTMAAVQSFWNTMPVANLEQQEVVDRLDALTEHQKKLVMFVAAAEQRFDHGAAAEMTDVDAPHVRRDLAALRKAGVLEQTGDGGYRLTNAGDAAIIRERIGAEGIAQLRQQLDHLKAGTIKRVPASHRRARMLELPGRMAAELPPIASKFQDIAPVLLKYSYEPGMTLLNDEARRAFRVTIRNGKLLNAQGKPLDTLEMTNRLKGLLLWVLDPYDGQLYIGRDEPGKFGHASLAPDRPGRAVAAGGQIEVTQGVPGYIDRLNGHNLTSEKQFRSAVAHLKTQGCRKLEQEIDVAKAIERTKARAAFDDNAENIQSLVLAGLASVPLAYKLSS